MSTSKKIVIANWKMNPDNVAEAKDIFNGIKIGIKGCNKVQTVICPPSIYLSVLSTNYKLQTTNLFLGAQDICHDKKGHHTGEISAEMVANVGAKYVILGHSERREQGETSAQIARKINNAFDAGLRPVLCIGEKSRDEHGFFLKYIEEQLMESLDKVTRKRIPEIAFVYEPVWAISAYGDRPATPEEANEMAIYILKLLTGKIGLKEVKNIQILYGGSVDAENCKSYLEQASIRGLLVGSASLDSKQFSEIVKTANSL
ncbi:MAG: triose-phosphate isomerase [Candidatus Vogelbacteria bacterium]|nr:triose-phosphate isomerase [Candidatus Vogelbacteria bacterium]